MITNVWLITVGLFFASGLLMTPYNAYAGGEHYGIMLKVSDVDRSSGYYGQGIKVIEVAPDSPLAKNLGIREGDVLYNVSGINVHNVAELRCLIRAAKGGYTLYFIRMVLSWRAPGAGPDFRAMKRCENDWDAKYRSMTIAQISWKPETLAIHGPVSFQERPPMPAELQHGFGGFMITDQKFCNYAWREGYGVVRIVSPGTNKSLEDVANDANNRLAAELKAHDFSWANTPTASQGTILHNTYLIYLYIAWQYDHVPTNALNRGNFSQYFECMPNTR